MFCDLLMYSIVWFFIMQLFYRQGKNKKLTHVLLSYLKCWSSSYQDPASSCKLTPHEQNYLSFDILYLGGMNIIMMLICSTS